MLNKKALAGTPSTPPVFVEDVFSTFLFNGSSSDTTVNNGIDLAGKGGLIWLKERNNQPGGDPTHYLTDSGSSFTKTLQTDNANSYVSYSVVRSLSSTGYVDKSGFPTASRICTWTFRKQPKFFDVVTYTGDGTTDRNVPHNLGSQPGMVIIKATSASSDWNVRHVALGSSTIKLNTTAAAQNIFNPYNTDMTSTTFYATTISNPTYSSYATNNSGVTYVAYLFAHNAGGFGAAGTDNVISCGSFTVSGSNVTVDLGYEPQYLLVKRSDGVKSWEVVDSMRGFSVTEQAELYPNESGGEGVDSRTIPTATGFTIRSDFGNGTYIYMAIRRPMKPPTSGTEVFSPSAASGVITTGFPVDLNIIGFRSGDSVNAAARARLTNAPYLVTSSTAAEAGSSSVGFDSNTGLTLSMDSGLINWNFRRAPGFFDVVCYTGTGSARTVAHNLGVAPELMIVKQRSGSGTGWGVYSVTLGATKYLNLQSTDGENTFSGLWNDSTPTSSVFTVGSSAKTNGSGSTYVAYLFASVAGVSKVFSFTGNGSSQTINCGFTAGARLVLIKRTDSTGDWYIWDSSRGIVSGNDPHLSLNSTAAEVTTDDSIDPDSSGFVVNQLAATNINVSSATYIGIAIS